MNQHIHVAKSQITVYKQELAIGVAVILGLVVIVVVIALTVYNSTPKVVYQPAKACDLLTAVEAKQLLGDHVLNSSKRDPALSGDTATSTCGYANGNPDKNTMIVAAMTIRSGINDKGVQQNKTEFAANKSAKNVDPVNGLGDSAYFNQELGQLNILDGRKWIILSYGVGSAPETNTVEMATELARKVL